MSLEQPANVQVTSVSKSGEPLRSAAAAIYVITQSVSEEDGLDAGSTVNFLLIDQRVRFEISVGASQSAGLKLASELLAVAIRVRGRRVCSEAGCDEAATSTDVPPCIREATQR